MHLRRSIALAALLLPALTSCGFNYATDRVDTPGAGVNNRDKTVDVVGAMIVSAAPGSGTFLATLSNNSNSEPATFDTLSGASGGTVTAGEFEAVDIAAQGFVNLAEPGGVPISGDFAAGDFVPVAVGFSNGDRVVLEVPVMPDCDEYDGLDTSAGGAGGGESAGTPSADPTATVGDEVESGATECGVPQPSENVEETTGEQDGEE